jgi:dihydroorotase
MSSLLLVNAQVVNEGRIAAADVLIRGERIERVGPGPVPAGTTTIDLRGKHLLPGLIDDQVHCREPGLTHKATLGTESLAALCGGVTSFLDMPNTQPPTTDRAALAEKRGIAAATCHVNYGFYLGATNTNLEEIKRVTCDDACGVKVFMGASTGNMLVDDPATLEGIFANARVPIAAHCEYSPLIWENEKRYRERYGDNVPIEAHPSIRSEEACYRSSSMAVGLAKKHGARLHILHLTTARELELFERGPVAGKRITKARSYFEAPSGLPLVQHSLLMLLDQHAQGLFTLPKIVEKAAHNPAVLFGIAERGFVREGYYADLVAVDLAGRTRVDAAQVRYKCGWSPFEGTEFRGAVALTILNGVPVFRDGHPAAGPRMAQALRFNAR